MSNPSNASKRITPLTTINPTQLKDDVVSKAIAMGFTLNELQAYEKAMEYRKKYNARPAVIEKRKAYRQERYEKQKALRNLLKGM